MHIADAAPLYNGDSIGTFPRHLPSCRILCPIPFPSFSLLSSCSVSSLCLLLVCRRLSSAVIGHFLPQSSCLSHTWNQSHVLLFYFSFGRESNFSTLLQVAASKPNGHCTSRLTFLACQLTDSTADPKQLHAYHNNTSRVARHRYHSACFWYPLRTFEHSYFLPASSSASCSVIAGSQSSLEHAVRAFRSFA